MPTTWAVLPALIIGAVSGIGKTMVWASNGMPSMLNSDRLEGSLRGLTA